MYFFAQIFAVNVSKETVAAGVTMLCIVLAFYLFFRDMRRGLAKPYVLAWGLRVAIVALAFAAQAAKGATYSLALSGTQLAGGVLLIVYMLVRQRRRGRLDAVDYIGIGAAFAGLMVWEVSGDAIYAALGCIAADIAATVVGVRAAFMKGAADSLAFWLCCLAASVMAVVVVAGQPAAIALVPIASLTNAVVNITTIVVLRMRRQAQAHEAPDSEPA